MGCRMLPVLLWCEGLSTTVEGVGPGMPSTGIVKPGTLVYAYGGAAWERREALL